MGGVESKSLLHAPALVDYSSPPPFGPFAQVPFATRRLRVVDRVVLIAAGSVLAAMLTTAWRLSPDPRGLGTHQQLGLDPCTVVQWFGIRCPSCGMTTSWSHTVRGQLVQAVQVNAGGALLAGCAILAAPWLLASGVTGRWLAARPNETWLFGTALAVVVVTLTQWAVRLSLGW